MTIPLWCCSAHHIDYMKRPFDAQLWPALQDLIGPAELTCAVLTRGGPPAAAASVRRILAPAAPIPPTCGPRSPGLLAGLRHGILLLPGQLGGSKRPAAHVTYRQPQPQAPADRWCLIHAKEQSLT